MNERWLPVVGYEGWYSVSDRGRVRRDLQRKGTTAGKILRHVGCNGYGTVVLSKEGITKRFTVHLLVARAFLGQAPTGKQVNHKNGIRNDSRLENLEYVTQQENILHGRRVLGHNRGSSVHSAKADEAKVAEIRKARDRGASFPSLVRQFGLSAGAIFKIVHKQTWMHV